MPTFHKIPKKCKYSKKTRHDISKCKYCYDYRNMVKHLNIKSSLVMIMDIFNQGRFIQKENSSKKALKLKTLQKRSIRKTLDIHRQ